MNCPATARESTWSTKILVRVTVLSGQDISYRLYHRAGWVALAGCFGRFLWHKKYRFRYRTSRAGPALHDLARVDSCARSKPLCRCAGVALPAHRAPYTRSESHEAYAGPLEGFRRSQGPGGGLDPTGCGDHTVSVHVWCGCFYIETGISCATRKVKPLRPRVSTWSAKIVVRVTILSSQDIRCSINHMVGWVPLAGCFDRFLWHKKNRFLYRTSRAGPELANGHHTCPGTVVTKSPAPTFTPAGST
jgi:hypothetical protein